MKNATATSHGKSCLLEADGGREEALIGWVPKLVVGFFPIAVDISSPPPK
jgi:hypothetical protein